MNTIPPDDQRVPSGYLSEKHKRKFTITAGILGAAFFIMQFILPPMLMFVIMPGMMFFHDSWMKAAEPQHGTFWKDSIWYVERSFSTKPSLHGRTRLKRLNLDSEEGPESVAALTIGNAWLLPGSDRLWIISASAIGFYQNGKITVISEEKKLGDISRPFLYEGYPAVVEERPTSLTLMVFVEDTWQEKLRFKLKFQENRGRIHRYLQALSSDGTLHLFLKFGKTLYYREGPPPEAIDDRGIWQPVAEVGCDWVALLTDGEPVVFHCGTRNGSWKIVGLRLRGERWRPFSAYEAGLTSEMGVYPLGQPDRFAMLLQSFPGSLRLVQVDGTRVISEIRHGSGFPFPRGFMVMMAGFYVPTLILPLVLAVILSGFMMRHRICEHRDGSVSMPFASLTRRALAQIVDFFVLGAPAIAGALLLYPIYDMEKMFSSGPFPFLAGFGLIAGTLLWGFVCLFAFSFLEGKWGVTPGKWVVGIRVLGTDLQSCGFGRAFVRNLLKFIDGFFNFMIGILLVALTENWQRVGDMAARTVVVDVRREEILLLK
jgi:uncharacterized RDD family membrane protein YckC